MCLFATVDLTSQTATQTKVNDRHVEHKERQAHRPHGYKKAPDLSFVGGDGSSEMRQHYSWKGQQVRKVKPTQCC